MAQTGDLLLPTPDAYGDWKEYARALISALEGSEIQRGVAVANAIAGTNNLPNGFSNIITEDANESLWIWKPGGRLPDAEDLFSIDTQHIADAAIVTAHLQGQVITSEKLADLAVEARAIAEGAVTGGKLPDGVITQAKIGALAVGAAAIQDLAVGTAKIAFGAIVTTHIGDAQITNAKIANLAVNEAKLADAAIGSAKIQDAAITNAKLENLSVTNAKIGDGAITSLKIGGKQVTTAKIDDLAVGTAQLADAAITRAKIGFAAIGNAEIDNASITNAKIANGAVDQLKISGPFYSTNFVPGVSGYYIDPITGITQFNFPLLSRDLELASGNFKVGPFAQSEPTSEIDYGTFAFDTGVTTSAWLASTGPTDVMVGFSGDDGGTSLGAYGGEEAISYVEARMNRHWLRTRWTGAATIWIEVQIVGRFAWLSRFGDTSQPANLRWIIYEVT